MSEQQNVNEQFQINKQILAKKQDRFNQYLKDLGSIAVAFSGGVDSTFLLKAAHDLLGNRVVAITAKSYAFPARELQEASEFCRQEKIGQLVFESQELDIEGFRQNPNNRCYLCKRELFRKMKEIADENQMDNIAEGSNLDDIGDYRPGLQAITELGIKSPLRYAELTKAEIRYLSKQMGLPTWNKQSFACLSTRFAYGETITQEKLIMVDKAEQLLLNLGFHQVRVRIHGTMARIEIMPEEFEKLLRNDVRENIVVQFKQYGFTYVSMDLMGYRMGSMNEVLK